MSKAASFKNDVDISGNLDIAGNLILNGAMSVNSDITVISGNIGIGTTTPQVALDVSGDVVISNTLKVDGSLSIYGVEFPNPTGKNNNVLSVSETGELAWTQSSEEVVNKKGQNFFDLLTDAPREFTPVSEQYNLKTIEICWNFDDIIPSNPNNRYLNLPLLTTSQRSLPAITDIFFDISTTNGSTDISSQYSINIENDHDYATYSNNVSGDILNSGISYTLTYRSLSLSVVQEDLKNYSINIWGVNGSYNNIFYKLPYRDISFVRDIEASAESGTSGTGNTNEEISGQLKIVDDDGGITNYDIVVNASNGTTTIGSNGAWEYTPSTVFAGEDQFTVRTTDASGGTTDHIIVVKVNDSPTTFSGDINGSGDVDTEISGTLIATDANGNVTFDIINDLAETASLLASLKINTTRTQIEWRSLHLKSGNHSFTIRATDEYGGTTDQVISISIPSIYKISYSSYNIIGSDMLNIHSNLIPSKILIDAQETLRYNLSGGTDDVNGYQFDIYKVNEGITSEEYLHSNNSDVGAGGINLSHIMQKILVPDGIQVETEQKLYNSLFGTNNDDDIDIIVYIVGTNKLNGDHFIGRVNRYLPGIDETLPGFDEMNPWYLTNKINSVSLNHLSSGLGSGASTNLSFQSEIINNCSNDCSFNTTQIDSRNPIIIYTNTNALINHYVYFIHRGIPLRETFTVTIGSSSSSNTKTVTVTGYSDIDGPTILDSSNRVNYHPAEDNFEIVISGNNITARRLDSGGGWGMNLQMSCTGLPIY